MILLLALQAARADDGEARKEAVTTIAAVLDMPPQQLEQAVPVRLRGIVTCRVDQVQRDEILIVIQDGADGIWTLLPWSAVQAWPAARRDVVSRIRLGSEVEVTGLTDRGAYSPRILVDAIDWIADRPLPAPIDADLSRLFRGEETALRAAVTGIVQGVRKDATGSKLVVDVGSRRVVVRVPWEEAPLNPESLVDATVRFVGVTGSVRNTRGEFVAPVLTVADPAEITVIEKPPASPFETPFAPLDRLAGFGTKSLAGHRFHTRGQVTRSVPGKYLYLQDGPFGVRVETDVADVFVPGDRLEVAGFLDMSRQIGCITDAIVRKTGHESPPPPLPTTADEILAINAAATEKARMARPGDYAGCLVTFPARLLESRRTRDGGFFLLASGDSTVSASLTNAAFEKLPLLEPGSELAVTGIVTFELAKAYEDQVDWLLPTVERVGLLIHAPEDVQLLRAPPWWTPRRLAFAVGGLVAVLAAALAWVWLLRRQVTQQLTVIESKLHGEAVGEERRRIAREFHDTLEQGMAGLSLRIQAAAAHAADEQSREVFRQHRQLLSRLQSETRDFLWDLRDPAHVEGTLEESIRSQLMFLQSITTVPLSIETAGAPPDLQPLVQYHLVRIVREAIHNAIKHAQASRIVVHLDAAPANGAAETLRVSVVDDGDGFDVAARSEAHGHFGIRGMRERARRIGADLAVESGPRQGTVVAAVLPLGAAAIDGSVNSLAAAISS